MNKFFLLLKQLLLLTCLVTCIGIANGQVRRFSFTREKMGSPFKLVMYTSDSSQAIRLANGCFHLVDSLNGIYSDYLATSELGELNAAALQAPVTISLSPALWNMLQLAARAYQLSGGAFDITVGALSKFWRLQRAAGQFPRTLSAQVMRKATGFNKLRFNDTLHTIYIPVAGMQLDLGGIAKGAIAGEAQRYLLANGVASSLIDAGGDIVAGPPPPGNDGWTIGINVPGTTNQLIATRLRLSNKAVATSGDVYQFLQHKGKRYSHIIDPRTGLGVTSQRNVTVIAADGATADWLATACSILSIKKAKKLADQFNAALLITVMHKHRLQRVQNKWMANYLRSAVEKQPS